MAFGRLDIHVNNAGGAETKSIMKWTDDEFDHVIALNLASVWRHARRRRPRRRVTLSP